MFVLSFDLLTFNKSPDQQMPSLQKRKKQRISQPCDNVTKCLREINLKGRKIVFQCVVSETLFITRQVGPSALCFVHDLRWNKMVMGTLARQACSFHGRGEGEQNTPCKDKSLDMGKRGVQKEKGVIREGNGGIIQIGYTCIKLLNSKKHKTFDAKKW